MNKLIVASLLIMIAGCTSIVPLGVIHIRNEMNGHNVDVPFEEGITLARAIATTGGLTDFSSGVRIERDNETVLYVKGMHEMNKPRSLTFPLNPKDTVFVYRDNIR